MRAAIILSILSLSILPLVQCDQTWSHDLPLDPEENIWLWWRVDAEKGTASFKLETKAKGWTAIGFSPNGGMKGSDVVFFWAEGNDVTIKDTHAIGNSNPIVDESQDYELLTARNEQDKLTVTFTRKLDTCDDKDFIIGAGTMRIIYAYHEAELSSHNVASFSYHGTNRGVRSVNLLKKAFANVELFNQPHVKHFDVKMDNITILEKDTHYHCKVLKVPVLEEKHHIIGYEMLITEGNEGFLHHMLMFECPSHITEALSTHVNDNRDEVCMSPNMPPEWKNCQTIVAAWAVGGGPVVYPEDVGFPISSKFGGADFIRLEIHYDNPRMVQGASDSSGVRMYYTDRLRKQEAGFFMTGSHDHWPGPVFRPSLVIPPELPSFTNVGICSSQCTQQIFPEGGIRVFGGLLHSHLLGRKLRLKHIRNGVELNTSMTDENYDFNYQDFSLLPEEEVYLPGDEIITECDYNSMHRNLTTMSGLGTQDEMCLTFFMYYPRIPTSYCLSEVTLSSLLDVFSIKGTQHQELYEKMSEGKFLQAAQLAARKSSFLTQEISPKELLGNALSLTIEESDEHAGGQRLETYLRNYKWDEATIAKLQNAMKNGIYTPICGLNNDRLNSFTYPEFEAKPAEERRCPSTERAVVNMYSWCQIRFYRTTMYVPCMSLIGGISASNKL